MKYTYAESGGQPISWDGQTHLLCVGTTGSGKSALLNSLLWSIFVDHPNTESSALVLNPKRVGFTWIAASPRVCLFNNAADMESIYQGISDEMMRRYTALETGEISESELKPIYVFQDEMAALLSGSLIDQRNVKSIKEKLQELLILARASKIFVCAFTQTALAEYVAGTLTRANFSSTIIMHVSNSSELSMAANLSADDVSGSMEPTNFIRGEVLASTEQGKAFVRGMSFYHSPDEFLLAKPILQSAEPADFSYLSKRGLL